MKPSLNERRLVLGSASPARRGLLARLGRSFDVDPAAIDEAPREGEASRALAVRLARQKASAVAARHPDAVVIGSDQVADRAGTRLGKPRGREVAIAQLEACSDRTVTFWTAVCVVSGSEHREFVDETTVRFRAIARDEIERYVDVDEPYDCAGGFKAEGRGIALFESIASNDPTALIGLPLIRLSAVLRDLGISIL